MYWVLHIVGRDVRGCMNSTYVHLSILSTCIPFFGGICVRLSPAGSSISILGTSGDAIIPHEFNSVFFSLAC